MTKDITRGIRLTSKQDTALVQAATQNQETVSEYVRELILRELRRLKLWPPGVNKPKDD